MSGIDPALIGVALPVIEAVAVEVARLLAARYGLDEAEAVAIACTACRQKHRPIAGEGALIDAEIDTERMMPTKESPR